MLIEVLVALLIFSFGVLGLIGLQAASAKTNLDARFRTEAAAYVDEYASKILIEPITAATTLADLENKFRSPSGTEFVAWDANRLQAAGTGLPGAAATVRFTQPYSCGGCGFVAEITLSFRPPGQEWESSHVSRVAIPGA